MLSRRHALQGLVGATFGLAALPQPEPPERRCVFMPIYTYTIGPDGAGVRVKRSDGADLGMHDNRAEAEAAIKHLQWLDQRRAEAQAAALAAMPKR